MFSKSLVAIAAITLIAGPAFAQQGQGRPNFDANADGKVDLAEFTSVNVTRTLDRLDTDKNGTISAAELAAAPQGRGGRGGGGGGGGAPAAGAPGAPTPGAGGPGGGRGGMRGIASADADKDGSITKAELTAQSEARFKAQDANSDGNLTEEERRAGRRPPQ